MLTELSELQDSDEELWSASKVSFTIETRSENDEEIIHREYTFSHAKEWDKWTFQEFEENRAENTKTDERNWRREKKLLWNDAGAPDVTVPPEVSSELEKLLDLDKLVIQQ